MQFVFWLKMILHSETGSMEIQVGQPQSHNRSYFCLVHFQAGNPHWMAQTHSWFHGFLVHINTARNFLHIMAKRRSEVYPLRCSFAAEMNTKEKLCSNQKYPFGYCFKILPSGSFFYFHFDMPRDGIKPTRHWQLSIFCSVFLNYLAYSGIMPLWTWFYLSQWYMVRTTCKDFWDPE